MEKLAAAFDDALGRLGTAHTHKDLAEAYGDVGSHVTSARTAPLDTCNYYDLFMANPSELNQQYDDARAAARHIHGDAYVDAILKADHHDALKARRKGDYRLDAQQRRALAVDGVTLVDSKIRTFGATYNDLYQDDMPVFITADSVLHAWHVSFDAFYMDMEEKSLKPLLEHVLVSTLDAADAFQTAHSHDAFVAPLAVDEKDYVAVARSLVQGKLVEKPTKRVATLWEAVCSKQTTAVDMCGRTHLLDFSMMEPRGHYTKTQTLRLYFQSFMWLAQVEFAVDGSGDAATDLYQLRAVCCLLLLLREANVMDMMAALEATLDNLVGSGYGPDALTPRKLDMIVPHDFGIDDLRDDVWCSVLQRKIRTSGAGFQAVNGQLREEGNAHNATLLPRAFVFVGQYAAWDAFALSRVVFDRVRHRDIKVVRTIPSAVDVAFAVLANDTASEVIAKRMASTPSEPDFVDFRDGLPYASNLLALRQVLDQEITQVDPTTCSLVTLWMLALRELSQPSAHEDSGLHSQTWRRRVMNTQLGSYMQLKHDTVLTAKQPVSFLGGCSHPAAFVDPYPTFWQKMAQLATRCASIARDVNHIGAHELGRQQPHQPSSSHGFGTSSSFEDPEVDRMVFFANFADVMRKLETVATAQAMRQALSQEQDEYLKAVMEGHLASGPSRFEGWYPSLFYSWASESVKMDDQVIDIFTNPPSLARADPGGVLHLQVSHAELAVVVVDDTLYAGPIFNYCEFVAPAGTRYVAGAYVPRESRKRPDWVKASFATAIQ